MTAEIDISVSSGRVRALPVLSTVSDLLIVNGPCELRGWSLRDATAEVNAPVEGQVTSPAAGAAIVTGPLLPRGEYDINWSVSLLGAAAAADADNFQLQVGATPVVNSQNAGAAGVYPQLTVRENLPGANAFSVKAIAAGTVGVTYIAELNIVNANVPSTVCEIQDGNQPLAEISFAPDGVDTKWMPGLGIRVYNRIFLHVVSGMVVGAIYASWPEIA